jgi:hypothetical protein
VAERTTEEAITVSYYVPLVKALVPLARHHHVRPTVVATCVPAVSVRLRATEHAVQVRTRRLNLLRPNNRQLRILRLARLVYDRTAGACPAGAAARSVDAASHLSWTGSVRPVSGRAAGLCSAAGSNGQIGPVVSSHRDCDGARMLFRRRSPLASGLWQLESREGRPVELRVVDHPVSYRR